MRVQLAFRVLTLGALAWTAACSADAPSAPVAPAVDASAPLLDKGAAIRGSSVRSQVFTVDPTRSGVYRVGRHWLYVPANVVCAAGSGYGPAEWDKPCATETAPFEMTVTISENAAGYPVAHIAPELRFAPSANPVRWVVLGLAVKGRLQPEGYGVLYQPTGSTEWIDESATDSTLRAWRAKGNVVARRLKHFSGYNVSLGFQEQDSQLDMGWGAY